MSAQQHDVLDPLLSSNGFEANTQYGEGPPRPPLPPPPAFNASTGQAGPLGADGVQPSPYYGYALPHSQRQSVGHSSGQSTHPSPTDGYQSVILDGVGGAGHDDGLSPDDPKRPRACEACRGLKVRCDQDPARPEIPCKRCAKAGRQCVITQPSRKRQKKADGRVAELEKKLDALTAALHQQQGGPQYGTPSRMGPPPSTVAGPAYYSPGRADGGSLMNEPGPDEPVLPSYKRERSDDGLGETPSYDRADVVTNYSLSRKASGQRLEEAPPPFNRTAHSRDNHDDTQPLPSHVSPEAFIARINSLITPDMASMIFQRYVTKLAPHLPAVVFPPQTTAEQVLRDKPVLFACILSAASHGMLHVDISRRLSTEAIGAIADCVVLQGAKSLELIQAMQVTALWYKPPERAEQANFYQIIHMAAVMALDIGLGKRFDAAKARRGFGGPGAQFAPGFGRNLPQNSDTLDARRAWLGCYCLCASASMVLRRPNLIRWTNYMKECIEVLESHPDAYQSDKLFCQHIKIQHICEDIGKQFLMDDNTAQISITDPKVAYALSVLENQLKQWKEQIPAECRNPGLQFFEHVTSLYLHEIALHLNHNIEDFRLPFTEESLKSVNNSPDTLTQNQMAALEACLTAAHGILDTMLSHTIQTVKTLPMLIYFVRCSYAIVILIKMHVAVSTPGSELGKMMTAEELKVDYYIDSLIALFSYVAKEDDDQPSPKILRILGVLRDWFTKHKRSTMGSSGGARPLSDPGKTQLQQTPLHLLSQAAAGDRQNDSATDPAAPHQQNWTFANSNVYNYSNPTNNNTVPSAAHSPGVAPVRGVYPTDSYTMDQGLAVDPNNHDFGWGSGFEQAMDMALGGMDHLPDAGLDNWFLGDSMAPFGFAGDMSGSGGGPWPQDQ